MKKLALLAAFGLLAGVASADGIKNDVTVNVAVAPYTVVKAPSSISLTAKFDGAAWTIANTADASYVVDSNTGWSATAVLGDVSNGSITLDGTYKDAINSWLGTNFKLSSGGQFGAGQTFTLHKDASITVNDPTKLGLAYKAGTYTGTLTITLIPE